MTPARGRFSRLCEIAVLLTGGAAVLTCAMALPHLARWWEEERALSALDGPGWMVAAASLERLKCERAVPKLFALLPRDVEESFQEHAAGKALLGIGRPAFQHAITILAHGTVEQRSLAWRLFTFMPSDLGALLVPAASDPSTEVRLAAASLLPAIFPDPGGLAAHLRLLRDPLPGVRLAALEGIAGAKDRAEQLIPALDAILRDPSEESDIRWKAGSVLHYFPPSLTIPPLLRGLDHHDPLVRRIAASTLSQLEDGAQDAIPALERLLGDPDVDVKESALSALDRISVSMACLQPAIELLASRPGHPSALSVISRIGPSAARAVPALIADLEGSSSQSRLAVIGAIGSIGPAAQAAVPLLEHAMEGDGTNPCAEAAQALARIEPAILVKDTLFLERGLRTEPEGFRDALVIVGLEALPAVTRLLKSEDPEMRALAAEYLGTFGEAAAGAVPSLTAELRGEYPIPIEKAVGALGQIGPAARSASPALVALTHRVFEETIGCDLDVIAEAMGRLGVRDDPVPKLLGRMARTAANSCRAHALLALGRLRARDEESMKLLREGLGSADWLVQYFAAQALLHLGIRDESVDVALGRLYEQDQPQDMLRAHAGFPEETRRILTHCRKWLRFGDARLVGLVAQRIAEVGPDARSTLKPLEKARQNLLEQREHSISAFFDSGGSHLEGIAVKQALQRVECAIESISGDMPHMSRSEER